MNKQKQGFSAIIFVILVVICLMVAVYFLVIQKNKINLTVFLNHSLTQTTDSTANWKIYVNSDFKFQFKYPNDWSIKEEVLDSKTGLKTVTVTSSGKYGFMDIWFFNEGNLEQFKKEQLVKNEKWENTTLNNIPCIIQMIDSKNRLYACGLKDANQFIQVVYSAKTKSINEGIKLLDQILSTFKFQ